jgi:hypothetical protein
MWTLIFTFSTWSPDTIRCEWSEVTHILSTTKTALLWLSFLFYLHPPSTFFLTLLPFWTSWAISLLHSSCWAYMLGISGMVLWLVKLFGDDVASPIQARSYRIRGVELVELCGSGGELPTYLQYLNSLPSGAWLGLGCLQPWPWRGIVCFLEDLTRMWQWLQGKTLGILEGSFRIAVCCKWSLHQSL